MNLLPLTLLLAATPADLPEGWMALARTPSEADLRCANHSRQEWAVTLESGRVRVAPAVPDGGKGLPLPFEIDGSAERGLAGRRSTFKVDDGWIVGFDAGEFGGNLWWFSEDGKKRREIQGARSRAYDPDNVRGLLPAPGGVVALQGLAHMSIDHGKAVFIPSAPPHEARLLARLGTAPQAWALDGEDGFLVVGLDSLHRVTWAGRSQRLRSVPFSGLYPNSMVRAPSGALFIGMRHFVVRLEADGSSERWLVPAGCARFAVEGPDCTCQPPKEPGKLPKP